MSLRVRLLLTVAGIVAAAVVAGVYAANFATARQLRAGVDDFLADRAARISRFGGLPGDRRTDFAGAAGLSGVAGVGSFVGFDAVVQLVGADGAVRPLLAQQAPLPVDVGDRALASSGGRPRLRDVALDGVRHRMITAPLDGGGAVQVARSLAEQDAVLASLRNQLLAVALAGTALAALVAWAVARRTVKPIELLTAASERVADTQDLATPIPIDRRDELGRLAAAFNVMLGALDTSRRQQRRLVVDASHELRTPITAVRTNLEFLDRADGLDVQSRSRLLAETRLELDELTNLVSELVELATDERAEEAPEAVDFASLVADVAERYRRRSGRTVALEVVDGAVVVQGRPLMLDRAVANLLDNALKFSPPGTPVEII
ncbi:MAG: HAMP domain-containing sensor histidine kinase, partial [Acidimicrobiales bacterium]